MLFQQPSQRTAVRDITYSELLSQIEQGRVHDMTIAAMKFLAILMIIASLNDTPDEANLIPRLQAKNISISAKPLHEGGGWLMSLLLNALPPRRRSLACGFISLARCNGTALVAGDRWASGKSKAKLYDRDRRPQGNL